MSAGIKGCRPQYLRFLTSRVTTRSVENRIFSCRSIPTGFFSQPEWRSGVSSFVLRSTPCGGTEAPCGFPGYPCPSLCNGVRYPSHPRSSGRHLAAQASLRFLLETSTALSFDNRRRLSRSSEGLSSQVTLAGALAGRSKCPRLPCRPPSEWEPVRSRFLSGPSDPPGKPGRSAVRSIGLPPRI
jgi:hypothetical protein